MTNRTISIAAITLATALTITACDSEVKGQPAPPAGTSAAGAPSSPKEFTKAPPVTDPLDATKYVADPCASLTPAQYQAFRAGTGQKDPTNPICAWKVDQADTRITVAFTPEVQQGLSGVYAQNDIGFWEDGYFTPTTVSGYPAVYASIIDSRPQGICQLNVGLNDKLYFFSLVSSRPGSDSCTAAMNVAEKVLETIKKGA